VYRQRGVCAVISPWNFPLAILTGMTLAAIVTGNTVIMKPAEQSSVVAAKLMEIVRNCGIPAGVVNFLPGIGEDIGPVLTRHPDVDLVAFTGSQAVGLEINHAAAETLAGQRNVRRVIAEMGGKNAISSRVIVLESVYEPFLQRLTDAVKSLQIGPAEDPGTRIGPVIDNDSRDRLLEFIRKVDPEHGGQVVLAMDPGPLSRQGSFIGPHIFTNVDPVAPLAQQELFGPILAVIRVRTLDDAITVANGTRYALTAGVYSRSPVTLKRVRAELQAGNLYLNREITGALVQRHPFGGYRMSGIGSKAGGPDSLLQFVIPVNISSARSRFHAAGTIAGPRRRRYRENSRHHLPDGQPDRPWHPTGSHSVSHFHKQGRPRNARASNWADRKKSLTATRSVHLSRLVRPRSAGRDRSAGLSEEICHL